MKPYFQDSHCTIYHGDCRDILPTLEPVDLLLTDPPYGIGEAAGKNKSRGKLATAKDYGIANWDNERVSNEIILLALGLSKSSIIFGGNYYSDILTANTCWLVWDKQITGDFADCELAWTNLNGSVRKITYIWNGMIKKKPEQRWHPTQKPHDVMTWCIHQADRKQKFIHESILDPFMGSGSTLRAAKDLNRKAIGIELEEKYCEIAAKRLSQEVLPL
jgi:DNA modification methylase